MNRVLGAQRNDLRTVVPVVNIQRQIQHRGHFQRYINAVKCVTMILFRFTWSIARTIGYSLGYELPSLGVLYYFESTVDLVYILSIPNQPRSVRHKRRGFLNFFNYYAPT